MVVMGNPLYSGERPIKASGLIDLMDDYKKNQ